MHVTPLFVARVFKLYALALAFVVDPTAFANEKEQPTVLTRQVLGGDLVYSSSALHPIETRAAFEAEARALQLLASECGSIPRGTRIFLQNFDRYPQGSLVRVSLGLPLVDCEKSRAATGNARETLTDMRLTRLLESYEIGLTHRTSAQSTMPAPQVSRQTYAPAPEIHFIVPDELRLAWERDLSKRATARMNEREKLNVREPASRSVAAADSAPTTP